ncbi:MAG: hypothetical protein NTY95_17585 [Bacteroidia bacterium]|nr:hypothetical protein [Bacteroidia bacterium]
MSTIVKVRRGPLASIPTAEAGEFITSSDTHQAFFGDGAVNYELEKIVRKGAASGYASLNASIKVVEDPANATATPTASKIVIADASGKVTGWVDASSLTVAGKIEIATAAETTAGTDATRAISPNGLAGSSPTLIGLTIGAYPTTWIVGQSGANLLTVNQSDAEVDTAGMAANWGTLSRTTTAGEFYAGTAGFKAVATSANTMVIYTSTKISGLTAGNYYCFSVYAKASTSAKNWYLLIDWYTAANGYLSSSASSQVAASTSFTRLSLTAIAPATAAKCVVKIVLITPTVSDILYVDNLMIEQASVNNAVNIIGTLGLNGVPIGAIESITHTTLTSNYNLTTSETTILTQNITLSAQRYCLFLCKAYTIVGANSSVDLKLYDGATPIQDVLTGLTEVITTSLPLIAYCQLAPGAHTIYLKGYYAGVSGQVSGDTDGMDTGITTIVFAF